MNQGRLHGLLALLLAGLLMSITPGARAETWVLKNVHVVDVTTGDVAEDRAVVIADGRIDAVVPGFQAPPGLRTVDGAGGWLIPGLAEMHAHVPSDAQGAQRTQDVLSLFLANGVTTIRGMLGEPAHLALRDRLAAGEIEGPRLITSGPSFNGNTVSSPEQGAERVRQQVDAGYDFLKIHPGLSRDEFIAIATAAREAGIPFGGHVSFETGLQTALDQGQDTIDHLDAYAEAMVPPTHALHGEAPQFFGLNLADGMDPSLAPALAEATARAEVWQVPTQALFETTTGALSVEELLARPGMDMLGDELRDNWVNAVTNIRGQMSEAQRERFIHARRALLAAMQAAGAGLLLGSDAPQIMNVPGYSVHQELAWLVDAGLTPLQALQTGTVNVARFFGEDDRGTIDRGQVADLVLLEANPLEDIAHTTRIRGVVLGGAWRDRAALDALLAGVRERKL